MLSDEQLGKRVKAIFDMPVNWQSQASAICALKNDVNAPAPEVTIGSKARNADLIEKQQADADVKAKYRTAPGMEPKPRDEPKPEPVVTRKKVSKKKASKRKE